MPTTINRGFPTPITTDQATIPTHMKSLADAIDADVQQLDDRLVAREHLVAVHHTDGVWAITTGLGEPVPINNLGDGLYSIGA